MVFHIHAGFHCIYQLLLMGEFFLADFHLFSFIFFLKNENHNMVLKQPVIFCVQFPPNCGTWLQGYHPI